MRTRPRLRQRRLADRVFELEYGGRFFLMHADPIRIAEIDRPVRTEDLDSLGEILPEVSRDVLPFQGFGGVELIASTRCNMRCTHCTARAFDDHPDTDERYYDQAPEDMSADTMTRAIDAGIDQLEARLVIDPVRNPVFDLFITGGEPLLVWNDLRDALRHARARLASLPGTDGFTFSPLMMTNGLLIDDEVASQLTAERIQVVVALDSPFSQTRFDLGGAPATPAAIAGLQRLIAAGHDAVSVNVVIAIEQFGEIDEIFDYLADAGAFRGVSSIQLSPSAPPIQHALHAGKGLPPKVTGYGDSETCAAFGDRLIEYGSRLDVDMWGYGRTLGDLLMQGGSLNRCPATQWKWCAVPSGDVYACHQLVGIDGFSMGNLSNPGWYDSEASRTVRDAFVKRTVWSTDRCPDCALVTTCMTFVDCPARSYLEMGDIHRVVPHYCECARPYLEALLAEHLVSIADSGRPAARPLRD